MCGPQVSIILDWPKSLFGFFSKALLKNPKELFDQPTEDQMWPRDIWMNWLSKHYRLLQYSMEMHYECCDIWERLWRKDTIWVVYKDECVVNRQCMLSVDRLVSANACTWVTLGCLESFLQLILGIIQGQLGELCGQWLLR